MAKERFRGFTSRLNIVTRTIQSLQNPTSHSDCELSPLHDLRPGTRSQAALQAVTVDRGITLCSLRPTSTMAHSKRNTSRAVFTSHERALAKSAWSSTSARLSRDSFLPFAYCRLCLENAIDPVSCLHGDLYCRECALSNILAQKKEIKRLEKALQQEEREQLDAKARQEVEAQERAIRQFELTQAGLEVKAGRGSARQKAIQEHLPKTDVNDEKRGEKRKFSLDADEVERNAEEERAKARRAIEDEKVCLSR